jgi:hypothetical protein
MGQVAVSNRYFSSPETVMPNYKMTRHLIILLTILFAACGQKSGSNEIVTSDSQTSLKGDTSKTFLITEATESDFINAQKKYADKISYDTTKNKKIEGKIKLSIDNQSNPWTIFRDTLSESDEASVEQYEYLGQFKNIGVYIVRGSFYESYEYYLIDNKTGNKITIWGPPKASPTDKFIANLSINYGMEGEPNGIQIWMLDKNNPSNPISKLIEIDQEVWVPDSFIWETDNSLILKVITVDKYMNLEGKHDPKDYYFLRLKIK